MQPVFRPFILILSAWLFCLSFSLAPAMAETWQDLSTDGLRAADEGRFKDAEALFRKAYELGQAFDQSDPRQATSINNLAYALHANGSYADAVELYQKAISLREATLGRDHPDIAESSNNLGELFRVLGKYEDSERLHRRAIDIRQRTFGDDHPDTAQSMNNLGVLYAERRLFDEAGELYQKALTVRETSYGDDHPATAETRTNLATLYYA
ncbi:MAG: tetratricopeptide repeat protein, partial [Geminicoccaceae bacterium]